MTPARSEQEGVVKFRLEHEFGPAPCHPDLPALMRLRDALHARGVIGVTAEGIGYGNVSMRVGDASAGAASFVISGTETGRLTHLDPSGCCLVTACDVERNRVWCRGPVAASSESMTHWAVYAAHVAMGCVLHVHSRRLFAILLQAGAPATPADIAYGTPAMALAVRDRAAAMQDGGILVMAGHADGILVFGRDSAVARAVLWEWLDREQSGR